MLWHKDMPFLFVSLLCYKPKTDENGNDDGVAKNKKKKFITKYREKKKKTLKGNLKLVSLHTSEYLFVVFFALINMAVCVKTSPKFNLKLWEVFFSIIFFFWSSFSTFTWFMLRIYIHTYLCMYAVHILHFENVQILSKYGLISLKNGVAYKPKKKKKKL